MLFLHLLLLFVLFGSSAAAGGSSSATGDKQSSSATGKKQDSGKKKHQRGASSSSQPPKTESKIKLGVIYMVALTNLGAKCSRCDKITRPVIPVGKVPLEYTNNVDHGIYFIADVWHDLPLDNKYTEDTTTYFHESDQTVFHASTKVNLRDQSINKGWARIAKGTVFKAVKGQQMKIRFPEKITKIYENMLQNFKERINSRSLKLDLVEDGLGQTFEPYFEFGVVYWMKPKLLGSPPDASGSEADHPVIPIGKVNDPNNPGRDLFFLAQISGYLPLKDEYKATAGAYFESSSLTTHNSGRRLLKDEMDIGWAQVALDVSFCYGRQKGDGKHAHLKKDQMEKIRQNMQANYDKRVKSGSLKLDFNKDDLNQYDPAGFTSKGEGTTDFSVKLGYLYWMKTPQKDSKDITHFVVPVGKVPDEPEHYFIAEMTSRLPPWKSYWKSAIEYFSEKEFVVIGNRITPRNWLINTSWAVEMPKQLLYRCNGDGRGVQMNKDKIQELLNSMVTNYRERRKGGESDFSITNEPVGDEGGPAAGQRSGQNWRIPVSKKAIGESSKSKS